MASAQRGAVLAAYRRALKISRDWPRLVGDFDLPPGQVTVAAQEYIRHEARQLIIQSMEERNEHAMRFAFIS